MSWRITYVCAVLSKSGFNYSEHTRLLSILCYVIWNTFLLILGKDGECSCTALHSSVWKSGVSLRLFLGHYPLCLLDSSDEDLKLTDSAKLGA